MKAERWGLLRCSLAHSRTSLRRPFVPGLNSPLNLIHASPALLLFPQREWVSTPIKLVPPSLPFSVLDVLRAIRAFAMRLGETGDGNNSGIVQSRIKRRFILNWNRQMWQTRASYLNKQMQFRDEIVQLQWKTEGYLWYPSELTKSDEKWKSSGNHWY